MKITRFYATEDGESRFDEIEIPIDNARDNEGHTVLFSNGVLSPAVRFVELPEGLRTGWHHAPTRQIVVVLSGVLACSKSAPAMDTLSNGEPAKRSCRTTCGARATPPAPSAAQCALYIYHYHRALTYNGGYRAGLGAVERGVAGRVLRRQGLSLTIPGLGEWPWHQGRRLGAGGGPGASPRQFRAEPRTAPDCLQRPLRFRQQVSASVRCPFY
jgi:hypothetical protein